MYIDKWRDKCYNNRVNGCRFLQKQVLNASQTAKRREIFSMSDSSKWEVTKYQQARFIDALTSELAPLRAKVGISQGDLAALIGVSRQTYSAIECGKRKMSWNTYLSLILFYDYNKDTHQMLRNMNAFPVELVRNFNNGEDITERNTTTIAGIPNDLTEKLDAQAFHAIRTLVMVEYARCTKMPGEAVVKAFDGTSFGLDTTDEDILAARSIRNIKKNKNGEL